MVMAVSQPMPGTPCRGGAGRARRRAGWAEGRGRARGVWRDEPLGVEDIALETDDVIEPLAGGEAVSGTEFVFLGEQPLLGAIGGPGGGAGEIIFQADPAEVTPLGGQGAGERMAMAQQFAQGADRLAGDEGGGQSSLEEQLGDEPGVLAVGLGFAPAERG